MTGIKLVALTCLVLILVSCSQSVENILFEDDFGPASQGEWRENIVQLPPPAGLGFKWKVLEGGYDPIQWIMVDEIEKNAPKKGFWVIPPDSGFLQQGGRSHNSILFTRKAIPEGMDNYDIFFRQYRHDNDYIGYILGAAVFGLEEGLEFGYMTQVPGTDSTTSDAYLTGALGEIRVNGMALMRTWASHKIEVREDQVSWYIDEKLMASGQFSGKSLHGYFGIRQRYDRNTRYDDVKIVASLKKI